VDDHEGLRHLEYAGVFFDANPEILIFARRESGIEEARLVQNRPPDGGGRSTLVIRGPDQAGVNSDSVERLSPNILMPIWKSPD